MGLLSLFLSRAFPDTQFGFAILFLILEEFALCFSNTPALQSKSRGHNGWSMSDYVSQKKQSLLKIKPLHHFAGVNPSKFLSTGFVREEVLPHFTPSEGLPSSGEFPQSLSLTAQEAVVQPEAKPLLVMHLLHLRSHLQWEVHFMSMRCIWASMNQPRQVFANVLIAIHSCEVNDTSLV